MKLSLAILTSAMAVADANQKWANLRRKLSYEKIAGYNPGSQVRCLLLDIMLHSRCSLTVVHIFYAYTPILTNMLSSIIFTHINTYRSPITVPSISIKKPSRPNSLSKHPKPSKMPDVSTMRVVTPSLMLR